MKNCIQILRLIKNLFVYLFILLIIISCDKKEEQGIESNKGEMLEHLISLDEAFGMYDIYSKKRNLILKDTLQKLYGENFYDSRSVWFDIETLKEYIKYVEEESSKHNTYPQGFKIYYGAYPDDKNLGDIANHQNVFIVPTTENKGRQSAYTIKNDDILFLKNARVNKAGFSIPIAIAEDGLILNRGHVQPPPGSGDLDLE